MSLPQEHVATDTAEASQANSSMAVHLVAVDAKVRHPRLRRSIVPRARLTTKLVAATDIPLVVISAPVGFGKTTLLAEWAELDTRPFAWLSLDRHDNDPVQLLTSIGHAVDRIRPVDVALWNEVASPGVSVLGRLVPRLVASIRTVGDPFVLVLNNLHEITSQDCRDVIDLFLDLLPPGVQVAVSSRQDVWLAGGRRRVRGEILELGPSDLAFDETEVEQLLVTAGEPADPERIERLLQSTEGWPAGIYLASIARQSGRWHGPILQTAMTDRAVADYINSEVLSSVSPDTLDFLYQTAILDVMCGPLCDAVVDTVCSGTRLESLARSNLFVVPLDDRGEWYRYHSMFRSVLLDEITRRGSTVVAELHLRAAQWWEAAESVEHTIHHARAAGDPDAAVPLVTRQVPVAYNEGRLRTAKRWLAELGDETIARHPPLAALTGWTAALNGNAVDATRWAEHIAPLDGDTLFKRARAALRAFLCINGVDEMEIDAAWVVANTPVGGQWRPAAIGFLAVARWLSGDADRAHLLFSDGIDEAAAAGFVDPLARYLSYRALLSMDRNDWAGATADIERARSTVTAAHLSEYGVNAIVSAASARLSLHRNETDHCRAELLRAMRLREIITWANPWAAVWVRLEIADVLLALADPDGARTLLREVDDIVYHRPKLGTLNTRVDDLRVRLAKWPTDAVGSTLSAAELRLLPYLQTHLSLKQIGDRLFVSRNTVSTEVASIYRKLGASGRSEAVDRARDIGLLAPSAL